MVRSRFFVFLTEKVDRTFYYTHYEQIDLIAMKEERGKNVASLCCENILKPRLQEYACLITKGQNLLGQHFEDVQNAVFEPMLQLPPMVRQTSAPECKTIFQITMACNKLGDLMEEESVLTPNEETIAFLFECLKVHIQFVDIYLLGLKEDFEHFAEVTYRFMVYRNAVMSLHQLCPFPVLAETMRMWNEGLCHHYERSHKVFVQLLGLGAQRESMGFGLLSGEELKEQGYMVDYVQGLVDQSIEEETVAFCGHSKHSIEGQYGKLEKEIFGLLDDNYQLFSNGMSAQELRMRLEDWQQCGLRPSTVRKICDGFGQINECQNMKERMRLGSDVFI